MRAKLPDLTGLDPSLEERAHRLAARLFPGFAKAAVHTRALDLAIEELAGAWADATAKATARAVEAEPDHSRKDPDLALRLGSPPRHQAAQQDV